MNALDLKAELLFKLAGDPAIYASAPFLEPMKKAAMAKAAGYRSGCAGCRRKAFLRDAELVGAAMTRLLKTQYEANPVSIVPFKEAALRALKTEASQIVIRFRTDGKDGFIQF